MNANIIPKVVVCKNIFTYHLIKYVLGGAGAAGVELAFGFKSRWSAVFGKEIEVTLVSAEETVLSRDNEAVRNLVIEKLKEKNIEILVNGEVKEIKADGV